MDVPYPIILGTSVAGTVEEVGSAVTGFKLGDRVVSDTPTYYLKDAKYGGWQQYVVSKEATTARVPDKTPFEDAVAIPFALLTAVAALNLKLGIGKPGDKKQGKVLIWGASGSVGGYAVQYASSVCSLSCFTWRFVFFRTCINSCFIGRLHCHSHSLHCQVRLRA
jgi:NADPH:quinone reductase-like Zn-dependent oxidoreductase